MYTIGFQQLFCHKNTFKYLIFSLVLPIQMIYTVSDDQNFITQ